MTATISATVGGSAGQRWPLLRGERPAWYPGMSPAIAGDRRHREEQRA
jgi:hypothetical protein